jgi:8-oxo-dGTP pyrophosphatase MutT (NUDIX family)
MYKLLNLFFRPWWRLTRGMTMGAQAMVIDEADRVLLVRHGYRPGWHFPGGGVEHNEAAIDAMVRELEEETGVVVSGQADLHGLFTNFSVFAGDHIALYVVRDWHQPKIPPANREIAEQRFFALSELPADTVLGARNRIAEVFHGAPLRPTWK